MLWTHVLGQGEVEVADGTGAGLALGCPALLEEADARNGLVVGVLDAHRQGQPVLPAYQALI